MLGCFWASRSISWPTLSTGLQASFSPKEEEGGQLLERPTPPEAYIGLREALLSSMCGNFDFSCIFVLMSIYSPSLFIT